MKREMVIANNDYVLSKFEFNTIYWRDTSKNENENEIFVLKIMKCETKIK